MTTLSDTDRDNRRKAVLAALDEAYSTGLIHENGHFRFLVSCWFAYKAGGFFLERYKAESTQRVRWLNAFQIPPMGLRSAMIDAINVSIGEGRFFVSKALREKLELGTECDPGDRVYVEHAVPLAVLKKMIETKLNNADKKRDRSRLIDSVLDRHYALGWMLEGQQKHAIPSKTMPGKHFVCGAAGFCEGADCVAITPNRDGVVKNYHADPHFARYWMTRSSGDLSRRVDNVFPDFKLPDFEKFHVPCLPIVLAGT